MKAIRYIYNLSIFQANFCPYHTYSFILHGQTLDIVDTYSYLGIIFKYNGTFFETRKKLVEQANKALYCIYKLVRNESIPIDLQLKMFDSMIEPILLYGSEVWGYENLKVSEQIQFKFCKRILKVRNTTPHFMIYGEVDRNVQTRIGSGQKGDTFKTDKQKGIKHFGSIHCVTVMMKIQLLITSWSTKSKIILPPPPHTFPHALGLNAVHYKNVTRGAVVFKGLK